jgi:hypothetical protein
MYVLVSVDVKFAPYVKHTASRTKLASHANRFQGVPVNFPRKLTKDKVVKFQSLELAGWYQTVPYLWLEKPCEMTYIYKKLSASKLETIRELQSVKQNIAERMT